MKRFLLPLIFAFLSLHASEKPNVLFIICDDLNDFVTGIGGAEGHPQSTTPHLAKFAEKATSFPMAYTNNPVCAPSRSSLLYGLHHHTSGNYFWEEWYDSGEVAKNSYTLNRFFKENGYYTIGTGKVNHHKWKGYRNRRSPEFAVNRDLEWDEYKWMTDYGPYWGNAEKEFYAMPDVPAPFSEIGSIDGSFGSLKQAWKSPNRKPGERFYNGGAPYWGAPYKYVDEDNRDPTPDERNAAWAAQQLKLLEGSEDPFFLAVGFVRSHTPLHAPQKYFDMFPLEPGGVVDQLILNQMLENDKADTFMYELVPMNDDNRNKGPRYYQTLLDSFDQDRLHALRVFTQAYLACVAAVDDAIGTVLDALDASPLADSTIVVITSDHGFNMGEKDWLFKGSPWEESLRVPLLIRAPGLMQPGSKVNNAPVSLLDIYPTLVDLCGLPKDNRMNEKGAFLDGHSMRALIENPSAKSWDGPAAALSMIFNQGKPKRPAEHHYSIRSRDFRYIRYSTGQEELYDHRTDPNEWHNIAQSSPEMTQKHSEYLDKMITDIANNRNRFE